MKALLASLAGAARVVSCYRVSELATAPLECEQDKSGDFLLTLVLERGSRLLVSSCTTPGQVGSAGVLVLMGRGKWRRCGGWGGIPALLLSFSGCGTGQPRGQLAHPQAGKSQYHMTLRS